MFRRVNPRLGKKSSPVSSAKAFLMRLNLEEMIEPMAEPLGLAIPTDVRPAVAAALQRLVEAADAVMSFPLSDNIEIAQVFVP